MIVIFIGPPYAGKDTQGKLLSKKFGIPIFSMGALIREARDHENETFVKAYEEYSLKGLHVPTAIKFPLLEDKMNQAKEGFILDNFPATEDDLTALNKYLFKTNKKINTVIHLYISEEETMKRLKSVFRERQDDNPGIVAARREIQDKDRIPVINYFRKANLLLELNGEGEINKIHEEILRRLGK